MRKNILAGNYNMNDIHINRLGQEQYLEIVQYLKSIDQIFPIRMSLRVDIERHIIKVLNRGIVLIAEEGKLIIAGPLGKNENNYRGIFILNDIKSIEEAKELLQTDPAIKNGLLDYEIFTWYGSAALPEYLQFSDKIWKSKP